MCSWRDTRKSTHQTAENYRRTHTNAETRVEGILAAKSYTCAYKTIPYISIYGEKKDRLLCAHKLEMMNVHLQFSFIAS